MSDNNIVPEVPLPRADLEEAPEKSSVSKLNDGSVIGSLFKGGMVLAVVAAVVVAGLFIQGSSLLPENIRATVEQGVSTVQGKVDGVEVIVDESAKSLQETD